MKNKIMKTAIFGGSFDPPHYGHIDIVKNLEGIFDKVIVMPSYVSPFKTDGSDAAARLKLCKAVFASEKTEVSRYEISKKGVSYSVDTAAYLAKRTDGELYWVIGSEELTRLTEWHDIDKLKTLVTFYVVPRPNFAVNPEKLKELKKRKINIKIAKFNGLDISSTQIKIDTAFGKPNKYVPDKVCAFAEKNGLFDPYSKYVRGLYAYGLKDKRVEHCYGVAVAGAFLAKLYGADVNAAVTACILHDIAKETNPKDYADKIDLSAFPLPTVHSPIGAYIAKHDFGVSDEIAHAIYVHSTGDDDMTLLDEVVYLADKIEFGRNYAEVYYFRYLCEYNKDYALYRIMNEVNEYKNMRAEAKDSEMTLRAIAKYKALSDGVVAPKMPRRELAELDVAPKTTAKTKNNDKPIKKTAVEHDSKYGVKTIAEVAAQELDLHKGRDISLIDLTGKTVIADYFVIASVSSTTAVKALMNYVEDRLNKQFGLNPNKRDMDREWVALDYGSVIIHIFTDKMREFYNIERLWSDGKNVERFGD